MYLDHITLTTGHRVRQDRARVSDAVTAVMAPWLQDASTRGAPVLIPGLDGYKAKVLSHDGALIVTVYGPDPDIGRAHALCTFGVAVRSRHAQALWDMLMQQPGVRPDLQQPGAPWLASVPYAALITDLDAARWMGDFERTCAWAWVTRNPTIEAV